jgi:hypothetical protein
MRKLILISAFVLASMSPHAGESRDMTLAANDETRAVETAMPEGTKHHASRQAGKSHMRGYEADEAKARRIAARYGVYW